MCACIVDGEARSKRVRDPLNTVSHRGQQSVPRSSSPPASSRRNEKPRRKPSRMAVNKRQRRAHALQREREQHGERAPESKREREG